MQISCSLFFEQLKLSPKEKILIALGGRNPFTSGFVINTSDEI